MNKLIPTLRYILHGFRGLTLIAFLSILGNVLAVNLVYQLTARSTGRVEVVRLTLPVEFTAAIFCIITGAILFLINFQVTIANGVSRKTFLRASLYAAALMSAALALFNILVVLVHNLFWPVQLVSQVVYPGIGWIELALVQFVQNLLGFVLGWVIVLAYYRAGTRMRWVISLAPFVLFGAYLAINAQTGGAAADAVREVWRATMRSLPVVAIASLLLLAAAAFGLVYLLFRRTPLRA